MHDLALFRTGAVFKAKLYLVRSHEKQISRALVAYDTLRAHSAAKEIYVA